MRPLAIILTALLVPLTGFAQAPETKESLIVVNALGKEIKVKKWQFSQGTRHLAWLGDPNAPAAPDVLPIKKGKTTPPPRVGPEYLEIREGGNFQYKDGVLTLVPLASVRSIDFDKEKKTVTVKVAVKDKDESFTGSTEYLTINKYLLEAEVGLGQLGSTQETFKGGETKDGIQSIRFPAPQVLAPAALGKKATILSKDKEEFKHEVGDVAAVYRVPSGLVKPWPFLYFQKSVKLEFDKLPRLRYGHAEDLKLGGGLVEVTLPDGNVYPLTLIENPKLAEDLPPVHLVGIVAKIPLGYKLFPMGRVNDLTYADK